MFQCQENYVLFRLKCAKCTQIVRPAQQIDCSTGDHSDIASATSATEIIQSADFCVKFAMTWTLVTVLVNHKCNQQCKKMSHFIDT